MPNTLNPDLGSQRTTWEDLSRQDLQSIARLARLEDLGGWGFRQQPAHPEDITSQLLLASLPSSNRELHAELRTRQTITLCGLPLIPILLEQYDPELRFTATAGVTDGSRLHKGDTLGTLSGPASHLLAAERVVLNFTQHLSGVATNTARHVEALQGSSTRLLDTRKTHPLYRALEKYAVSTGGGWNHRRGLYDRFMIKDNHLALLEKAHGKQWPQLIREKKAERPNCRLEVEIDQIDQLEPLLEQDWIDIILLDNFPVADICNALNLIQKRFLVELSGGVSLESLPTLGTLGADFISCGALTHQSQWLDIGLDIVKFN